MVEPEAEDKVEPGLHTNEEKMALWQMNKIAIEYKRGILKRGEATKLFSYWAELPPGVSWMLLGPMSASPHAELMKAFPDWITKDHEPRFEDAGKTTAEKNRRKRKLSGQDAVGRDNRGYWLRYQKHKD